MVSLKNNLLENHCLNFLSDLPYRKLILAYSGGIDSSVLLECILNIKDKLGISIRTIHINHNLNKFPSVVVIDSAGSQAIGAVTHNSKNQLTLSFSASFSGVAHLN